MKITVLAENTAASDEFLSEHGLSLYIETNNHKLLFDTGKTDLFYKNAQTLGIDLAKTDIAVISHGHYDHGGGISAFLKQNSKANIYINENAFGEYYNGTEKYIGLDPLLQGNKRFIFTQDECKIDDELCLFTANKKLRPYPTQTVNLNSKVNGKFFVDEFLHEQYLYITEGDKKVLISGCSHKGILNVMNFSKELGIDILVGGFHFKDVALDDEGKKMLDYASEKLSLYKTQYYTCHCTGLKQYKYLKKKMKDQIHYLPAGLSIEI